nr:MAG TPA: hypothetical protein [Caudoviricetes sp.]
MPRWPCSASTRSAISFAVASIFTYSPPKLEYSIDKLEYWCYSKFCYKH